MVFILRVVFFVALVGSITSSIYCGMVIAAGVRFGLRKRREEAAAAEFRPMVSVWKPLHGTEPGLERNLETFFEQEYPEFELLFCARHELDEGLQLARRVGTRYPQVKALYVTCGEPTAASHNAKVFSFARLDAVAGSDLVVTSDADVRVEPDYLLRMVQYLQDPKLGIASCVYRGTAYSGEGAGFSTRLDAVGKSVEMTSGVLVADMLEGTKFALGATMATRRQSFRAVGGYAELGQFYADDFELGNRLARQGATVVMATHVIELMVQDQRFGESFQNQLRWMQSTRRSRPWGHLGTGMTFAVPFGLLGLVWGVVVGSPVLGVAWLAAMIANRWLQAGAILAVLEEPKWLWNVWIYPLRDLLGGVLWACSYGSDRFYYRGRTYVMKPGGRVEEDRAVGL
jgi:ceramide glucosyltransferase